MSNERVSLHRYPDEVLAEVVVDDGEGDVRTVSATFDIVDREGQTLSPRGDLPEDYAESIRRRLADSEYQLEDALRRARP